DIYFAVYLKGSDAPLAGSVRQMKDPSTSVRWFFPELLEGKTLNDYEVYEVELTGGNIVVDSATGAVSGYGTITRKFKDDSIEIGGTENEHGYSVTHVYTVGYEREELTSEQIRDKVNSRTDTVTNARPGLKLIKTDMKGDTLPNARFVLTDGEGKTKTFISDASGLIAVAYLEANKQYTLQETSAPSGYLSLINSITIMESADNTVYVNGQETDPENGYYTIHQVASPTASNMPTVTIKNKDFALSAVKIDSYTGLPMQGVKFALYKEVKEYETGNPMPDYAPMEGYEELVTDENGIIPKIVLKNSQNPNGLRPGTYYLRETGVSSAYKSLDIDIRITISATGTITLQSAKRPAQSGSWIIEDLSSDIAEMTESASGGLTITVKNTPNDPIRIRKLEAGTTDHYLANIEFKLYKSSQVHEGKPIEGEEPILSGSTDQDGILNLSGLEESIYYLFETKTLDGYTLLDAPVMISTLNGQISASINNTPLTCVKVKDAHDQDVWEITVYNSPGVELPSTGGVGTHLIYLLGGLMTAFAAAALLIRRRRREAL
ncbi:MAG: LPXTG cell wall anchor domain-containing protein, partial [Lachnospiraceae bacterium]|nr:LPXTG cell wall anchor domain-containing protein [Lachnospiraceae bacterium]